VQLKPGTLAAHLYDNARSIRQRFPTPYEVDPRYIAQLEEQA